MITVHHLEHSRSQRILWLLEELGTPYEVVHYKRRPETNLAPPELKAVHPLGKSPVITDGDLTVSESGAITEYLLGRYGNGRLVPQVGTPAHVAYLQWLHFAEGSAMGPLLLKLYASRLGEAGVPLVTRADAQIAAILDYMEGALGSAPFFAGADLTGADVQLSFPLEVATDRGGLGPDRPNLWGFLDRIHRRPAYRKALERGGPYRFLK